MPVRRIPIALILAFAWLVGIRSVRAETSLLVVGGNAADHERATVTGAIENAIRTAGWTLSAKPLSKKESDGLLKCPDSKSPWTCIPASPNTKGIRGAFVVSVDASQSDAGASVVVITAKMIVVDPPAFTIRERYCEHCADDKLEEAGQELVTQLTRELAKRSGRTVVVIKSIPSSATLILDGEHLGGTDATLNTFPGKHTAMVEKAGYLSETREFVVEEGKTAEVTFALRKSPIKPLPMRPVSTAPSRRVPIVLISAGGAFALFGGVSLYQGLRDDAKFDYSRATAVGVTTGLIGLAAVGTGLYLLWRKPDAPVPTASVIPGGVSLGLSGAF